MEDDNIMEFQEVLKMKEKRRSSLAKGKKTYDKGRDVKPKSKQRNAKTIIFNPDLDYDDYELD